MVCVHVRRALRLGNANVLRTDQLAANMRSRYSSETAIQPLLRGKLGKEMHASKEGFACHKATAPSPFLPPPHSHTPCPTTISEREGTKI